MKTDRKGRIKLQKGDLQVGNFIYSREKNHIKVADINGLWSHRVVVGYENGVGYLISIALDEHTEDSKEWLKAYATVMYYVGTAIPFNKGEWNFLQEILSVCVKNSQEAKEFFGVKDDISEEEDAEIVKTEKELAEAEEEARKETNTKK